MKKFYLIPIMRMASVILSNAQQSGNEQKASLVTKAKYMLTVPSISSQIASGDFIPAEDIIKEVAATRVTERGSRHDDKRSEVAMETRKKEGYF